MGSTSVTAASVMLSLWKKNQKIKEYSEERV
jgi:hypothetical protein